MSKVGARISKIGRGLTKQMTVANTVGTLKTSGGLRPSPVSAGFFVPACLAVRSSYGRDDSVGGRVSRPPWEYKTRKGNTRGGSTRPRVSPGHQFSAGGRNTSKLVEAIMANHAPVVPISRANEILAQSLNLAGVSLESAERLRTLFRTIALIPDSNPTTKELANIGAELADQWANMIDCEREELEYLENKQ